MIVPSYGSAAMGAETVPGVGVPIVAGGATAGCVVGVGTGAAGPGGCRRFQTSAYPVAG